MIQPTAKVDPSSLRRVERLLDFVARDTTLQLKGVMMQATVFAVQSATKATHPGKAGEVNKMAKKYHFRPLEPMPDKMGVWFLPKGSETPVQSKSGKITRKDGKKVPKGIKFWNKKTNAWDWMPYAGKRTLSDKRFRIPFAGAAKAGWLAALKKLGKTVADIGKNKTKYTRVQITKDFIQVWNNIKYIAITSPASAREGIAKAGKRLEKVLLPKLSRDIRKKWRQRGGA